VNAQIGGVAAAWLPRRVLAQPGYGYDSHEIAHAYVARNTPATAAGDTATQSAAQAMFYAVVNGSRNNHRPTREVNQETEFKDA